MNDGIAALVLFIKAVDFMKLCVAFSVNPIRETPPQPSQQKASRVNFFIGRGPAFKTPPSPLGPNKENFLNRWWTRNSVVTQRLE